jgi:ABC-2 type transport system ATP-binding protein
MIEIQGLSFGYRGHPLFHEISLELAPGNIYGLLGVNGAGKSTLLRLITGLLYPASGAVRCLGHGPARREPSFLAQVFMLPEELHVPTLSAREYVRARAGFYPAFDHAQLERYLRDFDLPGNPRLTACPTGRRRNSCWRSASRATRRSWCSTSPPTASTFRRKACSAASWPKRSPTGGCS